MSRIRYSVEVQQHAVRRVCDTHISAAQVAREVGCTPCTIHHWVKKYQETKAPSSRPPSFVPVKVIDSPTHSVEIILPTGITLRLNDSTPQSLVSLIRRLEGVVC